MENGDGGQQSVAGQSQTQGEPHTDPNPATVLLASLANSSVLTIRPSGDVAAQDPASRVFARVNSNAKDGESGADDSSPQQSPKKRDAMLSAQERGNKLFASQLFGEAAAAFTDALRHARDADDVAALLCYRSAAYSSECAALFDLDPTSLAQMALKDADRAVAVRPGWARCYARQGAALFLLERFHQARDAYLEGLALEPTSGALQEGMREVQALLHGDTDPDTPAPSPLNPTTAPTADPSTTAPTDPPAPTSVALPTTTTTAPSSTAPTPASPPALTKRQRTMAPAASRSQLDDWDCALCAKLLFEPVTTPCGHTFCKECFARAIDHKPRCPYCRTVLHVSADSLSVTITLANILTRAFPEEYEARRLEAAAAAAAIAAGTTASTSAAAPSPADASAAAPPVTLSLPLFVMSLIAPGESMALNIFEPRYRLMVRRVMEGSRRLGMTQARRDASEIEEVAVEAEIIECTPQPDGRYYLELVGRRRVRILSHGELDGYRVARCEVLQDSTPQPGTSEHEALTELVAQVGAHVDSILLQLRALAASPGHMGARVRMLLEGIGERPPASQPERFSFWASTLACSLVPELDKATLLRSTDTTARLRELNERLRARLATVGGRGGCCMM